MAESENKTVWVEGFALDECEHRALVLALTSAWDKEARPTCARELKKMMEKIERAGELWTE